ncbi:hypothetical protein ACVIHH_008252 [Bradyrhizobium sp. USDA 4518]
MNADPASDRRDARARLQRLHHDLGLKLVRPASANLPRRSLKTVGDRFDHMEGSSSRTRRRHRSSHRLTNLAADSRSFTPSARRGLLAAYRERISTGTERRISAEEDLIILLSATSNQFRSASEVIGEAEKEASTAGLGSFSAEEAMELLGRPRREIYQAIDERIQNFAGCGIQRVDEWADQFRLDRRMPLGRALALLCVEPGAWRPLPKQGYVSTILDFFAKRISGGVLRGPLTRMLIGKSTRIDLTELDTSRVPAAEILDQLIGRTSRTVNLDPAAFADDDGLERRLRSLHSHALLYKRDTGIDGLFMGFPFLIMRDQRPNARPRIAPVLLWPIRINPEVGNRGHVTLSYGREKNPDTEIEHVLVNPALEAMLGIPEARRWQEAANELLTHASLSVQAVMDAFSRLAEPAGNELTALPGKDVQVGAQERQLVPAAVLFHLAFMGQAVMKDLETLRGLPPAATALEAALRLNEQQAASSAFRSRLVVVSGDEKQMPPTSFFASRVENDEAAIFDGEEPEEGASEEEREAFAETWNRREIKDCPDLLQLARSVLRIRTLQVHYRSKYRELISFSNASFYGNTLSVPVRHPQEIIRRLKPIEVVRSDGTYKAQTNQKEASDVVQYLAELWEDPSPLSVGVVTFNRKQADAIEDALEERAEDDAAFREALMRERERVEHGEDMGFFVKNVENVQGDERDIIVFSTTFGRNEHGVFRKTFGALGHAGGERRLNVAVTRAREKVVIATSMPVSEISDLLTRRSGPRIPRDYLQGYLEYARTISDGLTDSGKTLLDRMVSEQRPHNDSGSYEDDGFTRSVEAFLEANGYKPSRARDGGAFSLDFAVTDPRTGLYAIGVECDAPRHRLLERARAREIWRPNVLGRAVPYVHRVSSYAWAHAPDAERLRLKKAVEHALGGGGLQ